MGKDCSGLGAAGPSVRCWVQITTGFAAMGKLCSRKGHQGIQEKPNPNPSLIQTAKNKNSHFFSPQWISSQTGKEIILTLGDLNRRRALFVIVRHMVDPTTYGIAPHQSRIEGFQKV